jgi:hypothetical protein
MNTITRHNYESYLLDYIEGHLDQTLKREMEKFLVQNPDIKNEVEDFEDLRLLSEDIKFQNKTELLKSEFSEKIGIPYFDYLCIADIEKEITTDEKRELKSMIRGKQKYAEVYLKYKNTKLQPIENIIFPSKSQIKKRVLPMVFKTFGSVAAAIIVLVIGINKSEIFKGDGLIKGRPLSSIEKIYVIKPVSYTQFDKRDLTIKQDTLTSHNQTNKQIHNNDLAFIDIEPQEKENKYKETNFDIPDIKYEARIFDLSEPDIQPVQFISYYPVLNNSKHIFWQAAEEGVQLWKFLTSSEDFMMNNQYKSNGSIDKLVISTSRMKFSKTFNRPSAQFVINQ